MLMCSFYRYLEMQLLMNASFISYRIAGFVEGENFYEFHKLIAICENLTLEIFPTASVA